jgi:HEAT repeat protein
LNHRSWSPAALVATVIVAAFATVASVLSTEETRVMTGARKDGLEGVAPDEPRPPAEAPAGDKQAVAPSVASGSRAEREWLSVLRDRDADDTRRNEAMNSLMTSGAEGFASGLLTVAQDRSDRERVRAFALQFLGRLLAAGGAGADDIRRHLRRSLSDESPALRREAYLALVRCRDSTCLETLDEAMNDTPRGCRDLAIRAALDLGLRDRLPTIRALASDADETVGVAAIYAIGVWRDDMGRDACLHAIGSRSPRLAAAGRAALVLLDGAPD